MSITREARNAIKIEHWRLSKVPILAATTVYQGDAMFWDSSSHVAAPFSAATSGGTFIGVADVTNPIPGIGQLSYPNYMRSTRVVVVQKGLVEMGVSALGAGTLYPFDPVVFDGDAQHVKKAGSVSAAHGFVDPSYGADGKEFAENDPILIWITVGAGYNAIGDGHTAG